MWQILSPAILRECNRAEHEVLYWGPNGDLCFQGMETADPCGSATETEGLGRVTWCNPETEEWK